MLHPFNVLRPEYERLLAGMKVTRASSILAEAHKLTGPNYLPRYEEVAAATGVPAALIAALDERESGADLTRGLGQGDRWDRVSTHVPKGHGPFSSWAAAAIYYARYDHLDDNSAPWTMPYVCWKAEAWNGFGPRAHGINSGYLWAGTNEYHGGKYVADGVWDPSIVDQQNGIVPIILAMVALVPRLAIGGMPTVAPSTVPIVPADPPEGVSDATFVQETLNRLGYRPPLVVDGSYGKLTRAAVRTFQKDHGLHVDGLAGETETLPALRKAAAALDTVG